MSYQIFWSKRKLHIVHLMWQLQELLIYFARTEIFLKISLNGNYSFKGHS